MQQSTLQRNALASALALALFSPFAASAQQAEPQPAATETTTEQSTENAENARTLGSVGFFP